MITFIDATAMLGIVMLCEELDEMEAYFGIQCVGVD